MMQGCRGAGGWKWGWVWLYSITYLYGNLRNLKTKLTWHTSLCPKPLLPQELGVAETSRAVMQL